MLLSDGLRRVLLTTDGSTPSCLLQFSLRWSALCGSWLTQAVPARPPCKTANFDLRKFTNRNIIEVQVEGGNEDEFLPPRISCRREPGSRRHGRAGRGISS